MRRIRGARGTGYRLAWFAAYWGRFRPAGCGRDIETRSRRWSVVSLSGSLGERAAAGFSRDGRSSRRRQFGPSGWSWCTLFGDSTHDFDLQGVGVAFNMYGGRGCCIPPPGVSAGSIGHQCGSSLLPLYALALPYSGVPPYPRESLSGSPFLFVAHLGRGSIGRHN